MSAGAGNAIDERAVNEIVARANRLSPSERAKFVRALLESLNPALRPVTFGSPTELIEYLMAQPDAIVTTG